MIRAPFIDRVLAERDQESGAGRRITEEVLARVVRREVVVDPNGVDDPTLLKHFAWTPKGLEAYEATRKYLYVLFGGAKGGSKTVTGCRIIASDVAEHQDGLYVVMRQNYTDLHVTTKKSFERFFPPELIVRKTESVWYLVNGNEILWWAADRTRDKDYEKTRGLEATAIFVDESSQFDDDFYQLLPSLLRRDAFHIETGEVHPGWIYLTSNPTPGTNFLKRRFIDPRTRMEDGQHIFIPSLPDDNPLLPDRYIDRAFSVMSEELTRMLRFGDWDVQISEFVVIPPDKLGMLKTTVTDRVPVAAGIDIGLGRPDKSTVWCANAAGEMWRELEFEEYDTTRQEELLDPIVGIVCGNGGKVYIDAGAVGKGVYDRLRKKYGSRSIIGVMFGAIAEEERQPDGTMQRVHDRQRDQLYFWLREDVTVSADLILLGESPLVQIECDEVLEEEAENIYYVPTDKWVKIEEKDEIKRKIHRSPDDMDALVLCNAARRVVGHKFTLPGKSGKQRSKRSSITDNY